MTEPASRSRRAAVFLARLLGLLTLAAVCGATANLVHPRRIAWVEDWSRYIEARALAAGIKLADTVEARRIAQARSHLILDARPAKDYAGGHLPGAISLPLDDYDNVFPHVVILLMTGQPVMTYCSGLVCDESFLLTRRLLEQGFTNVVLYGGGFEEWTAAGFEVEGRP